MKLLNFITKWNADQVQAFIRKVTTLGGAYLVTHKVFDNDQVNMISGALVIVLTWAWSHWVHSDPKV